MVLFTQKSFFFQIFWKDGLPKIIALEYDLSCIIGKDKIFFEKWKIPFLKKIHGNMIFTVYFVKIVYLFPANMIWPFYQKSKDDLLPKDTLRDDFLQYYWKLYWSLWINVIYSERKIKIIKRFTQSNTHREN